MNRELPFREVHLDFHTSGLIDSIGAKFDKTEFQQALREGHVNSITLFSKCHHGYAYHPTDVHEMHPHLNFDLLGAQLEACREIGVNAPVYISAGFDEKEAVRHPEWLLIGEDAQGRPVEPDFTKPGYHLLCYNTGYLELLLAQLEEVMARYRPTGIFLDISNVRRCHCEACRRDIRSRGLDENDPDAVWEQGERVYANYCRRVEEIVRKYDPDTRIFHNAGHLCRGRRDMAHHNTHLELESLPTGGWGYDHFPLSAAYARTLGMEFLGMTGKFHTSWGEFGGFKHPNALRYEAALSIACGAKCSIGDQLHPSGQMNPSTYRLIGQAYREVEAKEAWCSGVRSIADVALLSQESCKRTDGTHEAGSDGDVGANRVLLEGKFLYDVIDLEADFENYKLLILPDTIRLDETLQRRLTDYLQQGGKLLATGTSGLWRDRAEFALDFGAKFDGENPFRPDYFIPAYPALNGQTAYVMYEQGYRISLAGGTAIGYRENPYFNRTAEHFSSHKHTPNDESTRQPAACRTENTLYISWNAFAEYAQQGSYHVKELLVYAINALLGEEKTLTTTLPDRGITTLMEQPQQNRLVHHQLFAYTSVRGNGIEVIEDTAAAEQVAVTLRLNAAPRRVYLAPQGGDLPYAYDNGVLRYTVPRVDLHQMVVIDRS